MIESLMHKLQWWPVALFLSTKHVYLRWSLSLTTARELYDIIYCKIFDPFLFSEILNMLLKLFFQRHLLSYETYDVNVLPCFEILYLRPKMSPQLTRLSILLDCPLSATVCCTEFNTSLIVIFKHEWPNVQSESASENPLNNFIYSDYLIN